MNQSLELIPKDLIRSETAMSRFPIHRLSTRGNISIDINTFTAHGELKTKWEVSYNSKYGQPTALAYKIDTLIINRRIEEAGKPTPKLIKLGSLREIAREVGVNVANTNSVKNALLQNVGSMIVAKFTYKTKDNAEREIEIADTRYGVVFAGEKLPNGKKADSTYLYLHDLYKQIIDTAQTRPLDYDYLKELSPMTQRFYELLSYQIYGAIKNKTVARMLYSEFCTYAPQTRFFNWEQVRPQMHRLHKQHLKSGYIESIECEEIRDDDGTPDWIFFYKPGRKARGEYKAADKKRLKRTIRNENQIPLIPEPPMPELVPDVQLSFAPDEEKLIVEMQKFGVSEKKARELVKTHKETVEREILIFPERIKTGNIKNQSGLFIKAVEEHYPPPESYFENHRAEEERKQAEAEKQRRKIHAQQIKDCPLCNDAGWRTIITKEYPRGAAKKCTHDPNKEKDAS